MPPRADAARDVNVDDRSLVAVGSIRPPPKPFPPRHVDGRELCKNYMTAGKGCEREDCRRAHVDRAERPSCHQFERYGLCERGEGCWMRHDARKLEDFDVVLMCDHELARRHVERAREIFGSDAVVGASRTRLTRKTTDCLICVKSMLGAAGVLREFYAEEPHGMAKTKRTFAFPDAARRTSVEDVCSDVGKKTLETWLERTVDSLIEESGATVDSPVYARLRAAPRWLEKIMCDAMDAVIDRRGPSFAARPPGGGITTRDCTHCVDAVHMWGRAYLGAWTTRGVYEKPSEDGAPTTVMREAGAPTVPPAGAATMDDLAMLFPLRLQDYRVTVAPTCRAYFKLHEALLYAGVPVEGDWNCVDVGAAPGGWTQVLCERLASDTKKTGGRVWAIDPAEVTLDPMPSCARHLRALAEDAVEPVRDALAESNDELRLVVCDANMHPEACARIALDFATKFQSSKESWLIASMKNFCSKRENWFRAMEECARACRDAGYDDVFVKHLFSNCGEEQTLFARRRATTAKSVVV